MKLIQITKKTERKTEQMELVIRIMCLLNDIKLSKTDLAVLSHYMAFGLKESTDKLLMNSKVIKDIGSLRNIKTKLKKLGFLKRPKELYKSYELNISKDYKPGDEINLLVKIDNR